MCLLVHLEAGLPRLQLVVNRLRNVGERGLCLGELLCKTANDIFVVRCDVTNTLIILTHLLNFFEEAVELLLLCFRRCDDGFGDCGVGMRKQMCLVQLDTLSVLR